MRQSREGQELRCPHQVNFGQFENGLRALRLLKADPVDVRVSTPLASAGIGLTPSNANEMVRNSTAEVLPKYWKEKVTSAAQKGYPQTI